MPPSHGRQIEFGNALMKPLGGKGMGNSGRFPAKSMPASRAPSENMENNSDISFERNYRGSITPTVNVEAEAG